VNSAYLSYKYTGKIGKWSCIWSIDTACCKGRPPMIWDNTYCMELINPIYRPSHLPQLS
jgi:hypothetical protein